LAQVESASGPCGPKTSRPILSVANSCALACEEDAEKKEVDSFFR